MENEKCYLCYESEVDITERDDDGQINEMRCYSPVKFDSDEEIVKYLIQRSLEEDGQILRFIRGFVKELVGIVSYEVFINNDGHYNEVDKEGLFCEADICQMIIQSAKEEKAFCIERQIQEEKQDKKDFGL